MCVTLCVCMCGVVWCLWCLCVCVCVCVVVVVVFVFVFVCVCVCVSVSVSVCACLLACTLFFAHKAVSVGYKASLLLIPDKKHSGQMFWGGLKRGGGGKGTWRGKAG